MNKLYGTTRETSLRFLLLLANVDHPVDRTYAATADYMATYGECFGITSSNLHGNNPYQQSEYPVRIKMATMALKDLVLRDMIIPIYGDQGYNYSISKQGSLCASRLESEYSILYLDAVIKAIKMIETIGFEEAVNRCKRIKQDVNWS